ncbi:MAG: VOC family protein [Leptospiraceae bacterium]|nr:VOC family protein [Leptospiraceae bacterium]
MAMRDKYPDGVFCWADLRTPDLQAAKSFYGRLLGWSFELSGPQDRPYWMATLQNKPVAGMYQAASLEAFWSSYISVDNMEASLRKWEAQGGRILMPPTKADNAGTLAVVVDPVGATVVLWQPDTHPGAAFTRIPNTLCWNELNTRNVKMATDFYAGVFGWKYRTAGTQTYQQILQPGADGGNGGIMDVTDMFADDVPDFWSVYFAVENTDDFVEKAKSMGGSLHHGPADIDAGRFAILSDPTGGLFQIITLKEAN